MRKRKGYNMENQKARIILEGFLGDDEVINEAIEIAGKALEIVDDIPRVLQNLKNMKSAWEDESFIDRRYAEAHIKSLRTAIEQVEQLIR